MAKIGPQKKFDLNQLTRFGLYSSSFTTDDRRQTTSDRLPADRHTNVIPKATFWTLGTSKRL